MAFTFKKRSRLSDRKGFNERLGLLNYRLAWSPHKGGHTAKNPIKI